MFPLIPVTSPPSAKHNAFNLPFPPAPRHASKLLSTLAANIQKVFSPSSATAVASSPPSCSIDRSCDPFSALLPHLRFLFPPALARTESPSTKSLPSLSQNEHETKQTVIPVAARFPSADRIVAIGDVHGDVDAMRVALRSASVIGKDDSWIGGRTVLVQVGDQLDRGNHEREILRLLFRLQDSAPAAGGAVHILLGNHELMNARLDFRFVTPEAFDDFRRPARSRLPHIPLAPHIDDAVTKLPPNYRARARALSPGGPLAVELARRARIAVVVGDNVFVHAGLSKEHVLNGGNGRKGVDRMLNMLNEKTSRFLMGMGRYPNVLRGSDSPVWMRDYSRPLYLDSRGEVCKMLDDTLKLIRAKRMIVGHTPQDGINSTCSGRVWRIDTGMSAIYGGIPEAIEINRKGKVRVFTPEGVVDGSERLN